MFGTTSLAVSQTVPQERRPGYAVGHGTCRGGNKKPVGIVLLVVIAVAAALFAGPIPRAEAHSIYNVRLVSQDTGKCLDPLGGNGSQTHLWACVGQPWQNWDIVAYSGNWHYIKNRNTGKCLDVPGQQPGDIQLQQYTCNYTPAQLFTVPTCVLCFSPIVNQASGKCVDVQWSAVGDYTVIWQFGCNGTRAQMWAPDNHSQEKSLYTDRWYQFYEDSYNYTTWMTLLTERNYAVAGYSANWASPITNALGDWNGTSNTVYFSEVGQDPVNNDVFIAVTGSGAPNPYCFADFGKTPCIPAAALGATALYDEQKHACYEEVNYSWDGDCDGQHTKPNTWWYAMPLMNDTRHTGFYGTGFQRQATTAHGLGHAIVLAHDGLGDGTCGVATRRTVMDYDCLDLGILNGPQLWDSCGVNHAYYDPNWGWSGC